MSLSHAHTHTANAFKYPVGVDIIIIMCGVWVHKNDIVSAITSLSLVKL